VRADTAKLMKMIAGFGNYMKFSMKFHLCPNPITIFVDFAVSVIAATYMRQ